jgi:hypothetical protein
MPGKYSRRAKILLVHIAYAIMRERKRRCCGTDMEHTCTLGMVRGRRGYHNLWTCVWCNRERGYFIPLRNRPENKGS